MIRHHAMVRLLAEVDADERQRLARAMEEVCLAVPEVCAHEVVVDAGLMRGNYDLLVVVEFADEAAVQAYLEHPAHQTFLTSVLAPRMHGVAVLQHRVDVDAGEKGQAPA